MKSKPSSTGQFLTHPSGQTTHYIEDNFTDPWLPHETLLIQHGFARNAAHWYHWVPRLSRNYRVIRRDTRGHGLSSYPTASDNYKYNLDTILEEIIDTLDQLKIEKVHFLGESTSGMLAYALAAKYPHRLLSIITCSSPTYLPQPALNLFAFGHPSWHDACLTLGSRGWGEALTKVPGTVTFPDPRYITWWVEQVAISSGEGMAGYATFLSTLDARPFLEQNNKVPTLILAPANSVATTVEAQKAVQQQIAGAQLEVINGKGHEIYVDMAEECQTAVLRFLGSIRGAR